MSSSIVLGSKVKFTSRARKSLREYLRYTTLDGFHYISNQKPYLRRSFWIIICSSCVAFSLYLIYLQIIEFTTNVTSNPIKTTAFPIWEIPFPALTICNYNIVYKDRADKFKRILLTKGFDPTNVDKFLGHLGILIFCNDCDYAKKGIDFQFYDTMFEALKEEDYDVDRLMEEVAHPCEKMLKRCRWKSKNYPCSDLFRLAQATNGLCCSFNYYGTNDVQEKFKEDEFLLYSGGVGESSGLIVDVDIEEKQFVSTVKPLYAIEVIPHDNYAYPDFAYLSYTLWSGDHMNLAIYTEAIEANPDIRSVPPLKRGCWFRDEKSLRSTGYYNYQTCLNECRAQYILEICNCVPYMVPKIGEGKLCTLTDFPCLHSNEMRFSNLIINSTVTEDILPTIKRRVNETFTCDCLMDCNAVTFEGFIQKDDTMKSSNSSITTIKAFHNSISCIKRERVLNTTWDMLLASLGGIINLCLGASICSLMELLYHCIKFSK